MIVLGLTGSVGMGKSTAAAMLRQLGVPVHDADATVHRLMAPGGLAVAAVAKAFPDMRRKDGGIDRAALGRRVFVDARALQRLERILHPLVRQSQRRFLDAACARRAPLVVLDVPLLFEGGGDALCDKVMVVSAPAAVQRARVMARPGMTEARFRAIMAKQMPDREKRRRADYIVPSGLGRALTYRKLKRIVRELRHDAACAADSRTAH
ncbi:MAG TPA: dephospho-CoA kinase [Stellaceae bacterium]|nr:dephospho-CoA kinase [Stellaceae bacterium]